MQHKKNFQLDTVLQAIAADLSDHGIDILWLYGSRAKGSATEHSDYDLAASFTDKLDDIIDNRLRPEEIALEWQSLTQTKISLVDINQAPTRLAYEIIDTGFCISCADPLKLAMIELKAHRAMELDINYQSKDLDND